MKQAFGLVIAGGLVTILVLGAGGLVGSLRDKSWKGYGRFTIVKTVGEKIEVESIDPKSKLGIRLWIPPEMEISTLKARGWWRPKSVVLLAGKFGKEWMADSVADYLGIAYTGIWSNLGVWDKLAWWNLTRMTEWREVDLAQTNLIVSRDQLDREKVLGISDLWGEKAREWFYASDLTESEVEIRVWNSTQVNGLAGRAVRGLESAGLRVVQVGEKESDVVNCRVSSTQQLAKAKVVIWIKQAMDCEWQEADLPDNMLDVYIGPEYAKRYNNE